MARALRDFPVAAFAPVLADLAMAPDLDTRCEAAQAMGQLRDEAHLPILINLLAERQANLPPDTVLTPHPGEAARLLDCSVAQIQAARPAAANWYGSTVRSRPCAVAA